MAQNQQEPVGHAGVMEQADQHLRSQRHRVVVGFGEVERGGEEEPHQASHSCRSIRPRKHDAHHEDEHCHGNGVNKQEQPQGESIGVCEDCHLTVRNEADLQQTHHNRD